MSHLNPIVYTFHAMGVRSEFNILLPDHIMIFCQDGVLTKR
jgi:hypothetical protein